MRLAGRPIEGHYPEMGLGFIVGSKNDTVTFLDGVEEEPAAIQIYMDFFYFQS